MKNKINPMLGSHRLKKIFLFSFLLTATFSVASAQDDELFSLGTKTNSGEGFSLYPDQYSAFIANDFGFEDRFFWIGRDDIETDFPYILPGPKNGWGGTGPTAGIRSHFINLGFVLDEANGVGGNLKIDLADADSLHAPHLKVLVNGKDFQFRLKKGAGLALEKGEGTSESEQSIEIPLAEGILKKGLNRISISVLDGGWIAFDQISLTSSISLDLIKPQDAVVGAINAAAYQLEDSGTELQPLLVEVFHLDDEPELSVKLDGKEILNQKLEQGKYLLEAGMPAVTQSTTSNYEVLLNGQMVENGE
ncbi:MAG TPA: polysaccharide lyase family protein, partial [Cyclobacteriaceae bacterium]|nr:polysaccharide lyase family protein [Cyclobacteriaceae bacterium]